MILCYTNTLYNVNYLDLLKYYFLVFNKASLIYFLGLFNSFLVLIQLNIE